MVITQPKKYGLCFNNIIIKEYGEDRQPLNTKQDLTAERERSCRYIGTHAKGAQR